jgi:hypothetical protein
MNRLMSFFVIALALAVSASALRVPVNGPNDWTSAQQQQQQSGLGNNQQQQQQSSALQNVRFLHQD